jgi:hypothetical protein
MLSTPRKPRSKCVKHLDFRKTAFVHKYAVHNICDMTVGRQMAKNEVVSKTIEQQTHTHYTAEHPRKSALL